MIARKHFHFLLILLGQFILTLPMRAQPVRQKTNFDDDWKFHLGHAADAAKDFNYAIATIFAKTGKADGTAIDPKFKDSTWQTVQLPHDWVVTLPFENSPNDDVMAHGYKPVGGLYPQNSIGWYRKTFTVARADSSNRFIIRFDGIFRDSRVWINGFFLGNQPSGYMGMAYDISDYLNFNQKNVVVVRVDASQYEGWFYEGAGIYRHVWLEQYNNLHFADGGVFVHTTLDNNKTDATVNIETEVESQHLTTNSATIFSYITDRNGHILARSSEQNAAISPFTKTTMQQSISLKNARLWSLEDPYLYRVVSIIKQGQTIVDSVITRLGVRKIEITSTTGLLLNGKSVKLKGVNCHQDYAGVGSALPDYLQYYRIRLLKEMGVNAYRTSHHAPTPELLEACDSLGILVLDENRLLNSSPEYVHDLEQLIRRDRNHPSVFIWSIGNEEFYVQASSVGRRIAQTLLQKQQQLDPTRTSTYAADLPNIFNGINEVIPVRGFNYRVAFMEPYHKDHPTQPVMGTEMGSTVTTRGIYVKDSIIGYVPDQDITYPWWANQAEQWWPVVATQPWNMGGFIWTGFDYRGEPTPYKWPNINSHFGVMDMCGFPKNIYYYYQSWWSDQDVLHLSPHWNWPEKKGQNMEVWVNSNAESVELFLNGKSLGKKQMPRNSHLNWNVIYQPGRLEAVGYRNGRKITAKVETTSEPVAIVLTPDRTTLTADGRDATVINVTVKDQQGREVPDANQLIQFALEGNASIIGVGNGDPSSHEPDQCADGHWQRRLFNGKCQLILQSGRSAGMLRVKASAAGWKESVLEIPVKK